MCLASFVDLFIIFGEEFAILSIHMYLVTRKCNKELNKSTILRTIVNVLYLDSIYVVHHHSARKIEVKIIVDYNAPVPS